MVAFLKRMPSGIPGDISRKGQSKVESLVYDSANPFGAFGVFGKVAAGKFVPVGAGDTAALVYGLLVRPYPVGNSTDPLGVSTPSQTGGIANVMVSGYMTVDLNAGAAVVGGPVYVRVAAATTAKPLGGFEAAADGANTILVPLARFMCAADAAGNVEIAFNV